LPLFLINRLLLWPQKRSRRATWHTAALDSQENNKADDTNVRIAAVGGSVQLARHQPNEPVRQVTLVPSHNEFTWWISNVK